jgi:hypothetical protein
MFSSINRKLVGTILRFANEYIFNNDEDDELEVNITPKIYGFAEDIVPFMDNKQFKYHFRMSPSTFEILLNMLYSVFTGQTIGQPQIELDKQLLITVWFLANMECIR